MQHISPSWHCERNTRRGPSHRLKTNLLHFAALLLLALAPRVGWAQSTRNVNTAQGFREALENLNVSTINITGDFSLDKGHNYNGTYYNNLYVVKGTKTINGGDHTINRGTYFNASIFLDNGANLTVKNLTFDGNTNHPNAGAMFMVVDKYTEYTLTQSNNQWVTTIVSEYPISASLTMQKCVIKDCSAAMMSDNELKTLARAARTQDGVPVDLVPYINASCRGGGAIYFIPGAGNTNSNQLNLLDCQFINNRVSIYGGTTELADGGAVSIGGQWTNGGEITDCEFYGNEAENQAGALLFHEDLPREYNKRFTITGTTIGGTDQDQDEPNVSKYGGGGISIFGGYVLIGDGTKIIGNKVEPNEPTPGKGHGGGIFAKGGILEFKLLSEQSTDSIVISHNEAKDGCGGGIYFGPYASFDYNPSPYYPSNYSGEKYGLQVKTADSKLNINNNTANNGGGVGVGMPDPPSDDATYNFWYADINFESDSDYEKAPRRVLISDNETTKAGENMGGGIFVREASRRASNPYCDGTSFTKCIVKDNIVSSSSGKCQGGGVAVYESIETVTFTGCIIKGNSNVKNGVAPLDEIYGGGVYVKLAGPTGKNHLFENCKIFNNGKSSASANGVNYGGGAYVAGHAKFIGCEIYDNEAMRQGGGVYMNKYTADHTANGTDARVGAILAGNCKVYGNNVVKSSDTDIEDGGGGIYLNGGFIIGGKNSGDGNQIYGNTTFLRGGGIYYLDGIIQDSNYVYQNEAVKGGGVYVMRTGENFADVEIKCLVVGTDPSNATDKGNEATQGGGIYTFNDAGADSEDHILEYKLSGCRIVHNKVTGEGGGVYMQGVRHDEPTRKYKVNLAENTIIHGNEANYGGGVYVKYNGYESETQQNPGSLILQLTQTTLSSNNSNRGGGIYNDRGIVLCETNGSFTFDGNEANGDNARGGGIYNDNGTLTLQGKDTEQIFKKNKANGAGGGMFLNSGTVVLKDCDVGIKNTGTGDDIRNNGNRANNGGGIYFYGGSLDLDNTRVSYNTATNNGGGIYQSSSNPTLLNRNDTITLKGNATFLKNKAEINGGGLFINYNEVTKIISASFKENEATFHGGGIYNNGGTVAGTNSTVRFEGNVALKGGGGGIYNCRTLNLDGTGGSKTFKGNEANDGGGIYNKGGRLNETPFRFVFTRLVDGVEIPAVGEGQPIGNIEIVLARYGRNHTSVGDPYTIWEMCTLYDSDLVNELFVDIDRTYRYHLFVIYEPAEDETYNVTDSVLKVRFERVDTGAGNEASLTRFENPSSSSNNYYTFGSATGPRITYPNCYTWSFFRHQQSNESLTVYDGVAKLSNCTIGGSADDANEATDGHGGGIYIRKGSTVTMTVENEVTHNTATGHGGGVYKDGTLKVEGHVIVNDNKAGQPWPDEPYTQGTVFLNNVHIPAESDDDQQILIIGDLVCGSKIGVTKTKSWDGEPDYGKQGEHTYETDDNFLEVRTPIARVDSWSNATPPALQTQVWALDAYKRNVYFDDTDSYAVWSMNYANADGNTHNVTTNYGKDYSNQNDYFIETWRSYAKNVEDTDVVTETVTETEGGVSQEVNYVTQIKTAPGLAYFAKQVNGGITHLSYSEGNTYAGRNVALTTNIYLEDHYWEPIGFTREGADDQGFTGCGGFERGFRGTYDGRGHFVLNPISILPVFDMGFFGLVHNGTVERTFVLNNDFTATNDSIRCLGGIAGQLSGSGIIDGCEATSTLKRYQNSNYSTHTGGIAGYVTANGTVRNSFAVESTLHGTDRGAVGGLVGTNAGLVANSYTKNNKFGPTNNVTRGALVGNNVGTLTNAYSDAPSGAIVGTGTAGERVYAASSDVFQVGTNGDKASAYTPVINADHLGYMWADNIISGKNIPLFDTLNSQVDPSNGYAYWARPALSYYTGNSSDGRFTGSEQPINGDLPVLRLWESKSSSTLVNKAYQGGFRSLGNVKIKETADADAPTLLSGNVLQYAGPDRDGEGNTILDIYNNTVTNASSFNAELDGAIVRADASVCFFVYGDIIEAPQKTVGAKKISVYEDVAILDPGTLSNYGQTYVGVTFDNSNNAQSTLNVNELYYQPLSRNWHLFSTPLWEAPLGFNYKGHNTNTYGNATDNYNNTSFYNNPWDGGTSAQPNQHGGHEFSWLNGGNDGHNRYWMKGWDNTWKTATAFNDSLADNGTKYPKTSWADGYWPSKVNLTAVPADDLDKTFVNPTTTETADYWSDENPSEGVYRYPYGMDFYSYNEPKYHYINFKRNGPNHWHTDAPHLHLEYTPEIGTNNPMSNAYSTNVNEEHLITGKGYIATIGAKTLLQSRGKLGGGNDMNREIQITRNENPLHISEGWNLVGNPYHAYLDFDELVSLGDEGTNNTNLLSTTLNNGVLPQGTTNLPFYAIYDASSYNTGNPESALKYYVKTGSTGGSYAKHYLHPHQGFYVLVTKGSTGNGNNSGFLKFKTNMTVARADVGSDGTFRDMGYTPAYPLVNLFLSSDKGCADVCVVEFNRPEGWTGAIKLRELRQGNGLLYAMHDDHNYAAVFVPEDATRVPIKFESKSEEGDTYTLSWETANGDFQRLILVDNITGVQYDMLRNSSYSFHGKKSDYWSRFYITFEVTGIDEEIDDDASTGSASTTFAFFDGSQWVVTNDGPDSATLDLIDLQGRVLHSTTLADGQARIDLPDVAKGMYLLRMNNNHGTKVQKIIVK